MLSAKSIQGRRNYMEDRHVYLVENGILIAMVCDGHGGEDVAQDTITELPKRLITALSHPQNTNVKYALAIREVIMTWGKQMVNRHTGSTLTGIAVKNGIVYVYNVGDSRTCFRVIPNSFVYRLDPIFDNQGSYTQQIMINYSRPAFFCTADHDSESAAECLRIQNAGGKISDNRLNGILSVTRALGDGDIGPGISFVPDIYWVKNELIVGPVLMYSDGVYESQRYKTDLNFDDSFLHYIATRFGANAVVDYAYNSGSEDNLTAMLIETK